MNNLTSTKRRKITTERFEKLGELCHAFDQLSGPERKESLIEFLERFSRCDGIPPLKKYDFEQSFDTESSSESDTE